MKYKLLFIMLVLGHILNAQEGEIIYQKFEPALNDSYVLYYPQPQRIIRLDLNQDGGYDWFSRLVIDTRWLSFMYVTFDHYHADGEFLNYYRAADYVNLGDTLSTIWWDNGYSLVELYHNGTFWVGFREHKETGNYYGWIEVGLQCDSIMTNGFPRKIDFSIYRTAYCTVPDYPFRVGQTSFDWGVDDNTNTAFADIHPNPTTGQVLITGKDLKSAEVFNGLGQRIASVDNLSDRFAIDLSGQPASIYFVNITDKDNKRCVKKVVKQ